MHCILHVNVCVHGLHTVPLTGMIFFFFFWHCSASDCICLDFLLSFFLHQENMHQYEGVRGGGMVGVSMLIKP